MLKQAKKKLIILYTTTTGIILTIAIFGAGYFFTEQNKMSHRQNFQSLFYNVGGTIQRNNRISQMHLSELEKKNQLIIHIEDNGKGLYFEGSWNPITNRKKLIEGLKKRAAEDNVRTENKPISIGEIQSDVYTITGEKGEKYLGAVFLTTNEVGYRSLILLQSFGKREQESMQQKMFLIGLEVIGVLSLFFVSCWMISKTLKPVEVNRKKQIEFIGAASHELRSPLTVIRANLSAIKAEPENESHFLDGIDRECIRMSRLVDDMLLLASVDGKNWTIQQEEFEIETLLIEMYDDFYAYCKENQIELRLLLPEEILPKVKGDRERIKQILTILLDNAVQYAYKVPRNQEQKQEVNYFILEICTYKQKNKIKVEVKDYGVGIKKEKREEIFERFYRVDKSRKQKQHFGLGLSIAKELVELQKGNLYLKETEGGGCTFVISIPIASNESII